MGTPSNAASDDHDLHTVCGGSRPPRRNDESSVASPTLSQLETFRLIVAGVSLELPVP
jgi:hypothetical protein